MARSQLVAIGPSEDPDRPSVLDGVASRFMPKREICDLLDRWISLDDVVYVGDDVSIGVVGIGDSIRHPPVVVRRVRDVSHWPNRH